MYCLELLATHDADEGEPENLHVEPEGAMLEVIEVELEATEHLLHGVGVAIVEGGVAGDTGTNLIEIGVARIVLHDLVDEELALGTWSDEGHVAEEDIPELRKLVEVMIAQELARLGEAAVTLGARELRTLVLGIGAHGAELIHVERTAKATNALLLVNGGSIVVALDEYVAVE